jgi:hypothetical protein
MGSALPWITRVGTAIEDNQGRRFALCRARRRSLRSCARPASLHLRGTPRSHLRASRRSPSPVPSDADARARRRNRKQSAADVRSRRGSHEVLDRGHRRWVTVQRRRKPRLAWPGWAATHPAAAPGAGFGRQPVVRSRESGALLPREACRARLVPRC